MNKIYLSEKSKVTVINNDIKTGLKVIIAAAHLNPVFAGQFKGILSNEDMYKYVKDLTTKSLEEWSKTSPGDLQKICKCIKEIAEIRMKSDDSKIKLSNNYESSALTGKPKKYVPPSGNKNLELIIVEGDSALGSAKNSRDVYKQGLFPIRGKLPNAFKETKSKFLANQEIASIITIIGCGYGKNFDISK
jgi:DNA gyrase subunit B